MYFSLSIYIYIYTRALGTAALQAAPRAALARRPANSSPEGHAYMTYVHVIV